MQGKKTLNPAVTISFFVFILAFALASPPRTLQAAAQNQPAATRPAGPAAGAPGQGIPQNPGNEAYSYHSAGRRDPFLSLIYTAKEAQKKQKSRVRVPIEQYELDQMSLEAIVTGKGIPSYALVKLPNGKHYTLSVGSTVGANRGKVVEIAPDHIVVRETVKDLTGRTSTHETILKLRKEEG